jgi:uncharacterized protein (TIGR02246 family)
MTMLRNAMRVFLSTGLVAILLGTFGGPVAAQSPGTEEAAVKTVIETMVRSVNKDALDTLMAQFADDAKIYTRVLRSQVSKDKYREVMTDVFSKGDLISAEIRDMQVTFGDPSHATVLGTVYLVTRTSRPSGRVEYKLEKRDGRWLIVETNTK